MIADAALWQFYDDLSHATDDDDAKRIVAEFSHDIERLLADEREPMECGHPRACLVHEDSNDPDKRGVFYENGWCSVCAEREKVREMCAAKVESTIYYRHVDVLETNTTRLQEQIVTDIRQLNLTAPSSTEEEKR